MSARECLRRLEAVRGDYEAGPEKARLVRQLTGRPLGSAEEVERFHEIALFLRAHPDGPDVLDAAEAALAGFARRRDVRRFRRSLGDTGIAGTTMQYAFSFPMARWLAAREPATAAIAWDDWETSERLDELLPALGVPAEMPGVDDETMSGEEWLRNARPDGTGDYATLVLRVADLAAEPAAREHIFNGLEVPARRDLGEGPDSRTLARGPAREPWFHAEGIRRTRPDLKAAIREPVPLELVGRRDAARLVDLARSCMSVRIRELEAFDYADAEDVRLGHAGRGLLISVMGMLPERRLMPEALYSGLFVKNGVPVGYWLASALFGTAEVAYNVFPTFRGGEAGWTYARLLSLVGDFLGVRSVTVPRYQIGYQNDEAIGSGAFWFYRKMGFEPIDPDVAKLLGREEREMRRNPRHRSSRAVLRKLTVENLAFHFGPPRDDLVGVFPYANSGHAATRTIARYGGKSEAATKRIVADAAKLLDADRRGWSAADRRGFAMWAPVALAMKELRRLSPSAKRQVVEVFKAKGSRCEADFVRRAAECDAFRRALQRLCRTWGEENA